MLLGDATPQLLLDGRWRLYDDVREELYGGGNELTPAEYRARVDAACEFLEGKSREWLESLRVEMLAAAGRKEFEKAAELRDVVLALEKTLERTRKFERDRPLVTTDEDAITVLGATLGLAPAPRTMECFDISHISGTFCVASMSRFVEGRPTKPATVASRSRASRATTISAPWRRSWAAATAACARRAALFPTSW